MGFKASQVSPLADEIIEFSELGDYIHMPLRTYSSGMAMRLAFAVSTSVAADILIMDEWLSAGDAAFSAKAQIRLNSLVDRAKILVLASHDENLIQKNCNKLMRLDHGEISSIESIGAQPFDREQRANTSPRDWLQDNCWFRSCSHAAMMCDSRHSVVRACRET